MKIWPDDGAKGNIKGSLTDSFVVIYIFLSPISNMDHLSFVKKFHNTSLLTIKGFLGMCFVFFCMNDCSSLVKHKTHSLKTQIVGHLFDTYSLLCLALFFFCLVLLFHSSHFLVTNTTPLNMNQEKNLFLIFIKVTRKGGRGRFLCMCVQ